MIATISFNPAPASAPHASASPSIGSGPSRDTPALRRRLTAPCLIYWSGAGIRGPLMRP
jgi:hypothetical protein